MRPIDADALYEFVKDQEEKETGAYTRGKNKAFNIVKSALHNQCATPTIDAVPVDTVSKMFFDFTGDSCACDFNGNDEWLPEVCELKDECPYPKDRFGCWKQYIKHYGERKEGADNG